jgi:hypothetical protein
MYRNIIIVLIYHCHKLLEREVSNTCEIVVWIEEYNMKLLGCESEQVQNRVQWQDLWMEYDPTGLTQAGFLN